jgi:hypothetical protein
VVLLGSASAVGGFILILSANFSCLNLPILRPILRCYETDIISLALDTCGLILMVAGIVILQRAIGTPFKRRSSAQDATATTVKGKAQETH